MPSNDYHRYASKEQQNGKIKRIIIEVIIAAILIIPAIFIKQIIIKGILSQIKLQPDSTGYKNWLNPPITTARSYYLFNISNSHDIVTNPKTATIKFTDTPPYVYNITTKKINDTWENGNTQIKYGVERLFTRHETRFNPSAVNDTGVFIDLLRAIVRSQFDVKPTPLFYTAGGNYAFYSRNAIEQLEGFQSDLSERARENMIGPNTNMSGFVYRQNGSRLYNVSITTDLMKKGQVLTFDSELNKFKINSSSDYPFPVYDGLTYPPMLFDKPNLNIFNSDFCKPVLVQFNKEVLMFEGINMHEYKLKLIDYTNCTDPTNTSTCNEVDKIDVSQCISASLPENTIFLSKAHFYGASNETIEDMNVEGFEPDKNKHDSFIYFEPYTGTPFKALLRIQINIAATIDPMILSDDGIGLEPKKNARGVKRLVPVFWLDQEIYISEKVIEKLRTPLSFLKKAQRVVIPLAILLTVVIIVIVELVARRCAKNPRYSRATYHRT